MCKYLYTGPLRTAILAWKEGHKDTHGPVLAELFAADAPHADVIVPIPPAFWRTLMRGFHPPDVLAGSLKTPIETHALRRADPARQMGRDKRARTRPLLAAGRSLAALAGKHVLVVDDVVTTGATAEAAIALVRSAKPLSVRFLALAAVP